MAFGWYALFVKNSILPVLNIAGIAGARR